MRPDRIGRDIIFHKPYRVIVPKVGEEDSHIPIQQNGTTWYTDGSKTEQSTGAGATNRDPDCEISINLGNYATVFQAEITAISACAQEMTRRSYTNKRIQIISDSQAALKALGAVEIHSQQVSLRETKSGDANYKVFQEAAIAKRDTADKTRLHANSAYNSMYFKFKSLVLFSILIYSHGISSQNVSDIFKTVLAVRDCLSTSYSVLCLKEKALVVLNQTIMNDKPIHFGIIEIKRNPEYFINTTDDQTLPREVKERSSRLTDIILEKIEEFLRSRVVKVNLVNAFEGLNITNNGTLDDAIKEKNIQGRKAIRSLNNILWDQKISKENKHRIYNTIVKSIVTYGSEVWQLREKSIKSLEATEMDYWRRAAGRSRLERIKNERIREVMGIKQTIVEEIRVKQLKWYGDVQRMTQERLPKQILEWTPEGRRKRGRPRKSWLEGINKEMQERGLEEDQWNDCTEWRLGGGLELEYYFWRSIGRPQCVPQLREPSRNAMTRIRDKTTSYAAFQRGGTRSGEWGLVALWPGRVLELSKGRKGGGGGGGGIGGGGGKGGKGGGMAMIALAGMGAMMANMIMGKMAVMAGSALMIAKISLILSIIMIVKKMQSGANNGEEKHIVYATSGDSGHSHGGGGGGWHRSLEEVNDPYRGQWGSTSSTENGSGL
ncbi:hypothetical protein NQ318_017216 [Aromia moschata]|uniref:RNase H type-1 domain-containing protein n=1 Tax=Aromia moschata TaxID=1265417 RepID=A0AAV8YL01_9CUCU|nr:hypothetical protein NQ318_017216 [Aromia moschata]